MTVRKAVERRSLDVVLPSEQLVRLWWNRMRDELGFLGADTLRLRTVEIRHRPDEWASTHWPGSPYGGPHLTFHGGPVTFKGFLTILVHELIHAILVYEDRQNEEFQHSTAFMEFRPLVADLFGLPLEDSYGPEDL
jgi:hypothetical protein